MSGSISGRVLDPNGVPLSGATVSITAGPGPNDDIAALTGPDGRFSLGNLNPGRYEVAVFDTLNGETRAEVDVADAVSNEVEIRFGGARAPDPTPMPMPTPMPTPMPPDSPVGNGNGVPVLTDGIDWTAVRLIRVSIRPAGAGPDAPITELLFSPRKTGSVTWQAAPDTRYTYTASFFLRGGLQRTVGPLDGQGPLDLALQQGVSLR
ncbi:carboxypeptidase-like regulatory domain-containing protein [Actinoplanes sp. NPDC024001]|uniref:carboxypeptidase-like regulatory domain-containing protein n=1 Tax=Actinoplanes sp. NPDC024001 TaxID=3154598 RepID=UPI0033E2DCC8